MLQAATWTCSVTALSQVPVVCLESMVQVIFTVPGTPRRLLNAKAPEQPIFQLERAHRAKLLAGRTLACGLLLLIGACVYFSKHTPEGACADNLNSPIRNFCVVTPQVLWRGERPNRADATWLVEHHVGTIVNLEVVRDDHSAFNEATFAPDSPQSVDYFHLPDFEPLHIVNWSLLDTHVAQFLAIVSDARKPVYVHCIDGIDRTSTMVAAYRVLIEGTSGEDAIAEMARFRSPYLRFDRKYISSLQGDRRTEIMQKMLEWKSRLKPSARIMCIGEKCAYGDTISVR